MAGAWAAPGRRRRSAKGQALWELGNAVILVLREDTQSRRAKEARAASRRARSAVPSPDSSANARPTACAVHLGQKLNLHILP